MPSVSLLERALGLFYAGNAFLFPSARTGVPGTYLGESLSDAADLILDSLPVVCVH